ncbi:DUF881 domain-containing protein [Clostridium culturomicium]|uniref:DUF881 domain-containing protein n=1 Tax=Clostridium culturomicium TaxID=1499683 RepID=UPI00058E3B6B|nr:DUF881 domain-containing protein [Clostridium culturomicium]
MKKFISQLTVGLVFLIFGFMIVIQLKSINAQNSVAVDGNSQNPEILLENEQLKKEREELQNKVNELSARASEYEQSIANESKNQALLDELQKTRARAGLTDVKGEGIIIYITPKSNPFGATNNKGYPIKDFDLLTIVNELYAAEAEAISINDIRLVANSGIRSAGNAIVVNETRISPMEQVVIKAIGSPALLENSLKFQGTISADLQYNCDVTYDKKDEITINKVSTPLEFKYIEEVKENE